MIQVKLASPEQLNSFSRMESDTETARYILHTTLQQHQQNFKHPDIIYLSIARDNTLVGFFILARETGDSIEFRRIVIEPRGSGIGHQAIPQMENYCRSELGCKRIWLDVYDFNFRGIHLYEKLGYQCFDQQDFQGKNLLFYEKTL